MKRLPTTLMAALTLAAATSVPAQEPGDSPLALLYQDTGFFAMAHSIEGLGGPDSVGVFTIAGLPAGAVVEQAYFITGVWDEIGAASHSLDLDFDGTSYLAVPADVVDFAVEVGGFDLGGYAVDVTADVPGDGVYPFTVTANQPGSGTNGALLAVVYSHASNPLTEIIINFGAEGIRHGSSTTNFPGLPATSGSLYIWTEADNAFFSDPVEEIVLNGTVILGGPFADIFNGNQGSATSFFDLPVTVPAGLTTVTINNGQDLFGWHYATLELAAEQPTSTEARTWGKVKGDFR